jgi:endo-1,4-beta-xylanase
MKLNFILVALSILTTSCNNSSDAHSQIHDTTKGLKDYYESYFPIGVAVSPRALKTDEASLVVKHFSSITAENAMKMGPLHPKENEYYWKNADSIVAFAKRNNIKLRGHALVWHQQTPSWFFTDKDSNLVSKEILLQRIKDHITTVVTRYKDDIYAWDVVNEVIADAKDTMYRSSKFYQICGEEFIAKAFEWAHAADPDAILFYNDYNEIDPFKRSKIISMIRKLRANGIPVHAVGLQAHWALNEPSKEQLEKTLNDFASLGLPLQITELDISVYSKEHNSRERKAADFDMTYSLAREREQSKQYEMIFNLFRKYKKHITGVTFWNISDRHSWLDNFPVRGRKDYPLLFDRDLQQKSSYKAVIDFTAGLK